MQEEEEQKLPEQFLHQQPRHPITDDEGTDMELPTTDTDTGEEEEEDDDDEDSRVDNNYRDDGGDHARCYNDGCYYDVDDNHDHDGGYGPSGEPRPLPDPPPDFSMDDSLSKELMNLSFRRRSDLQEELHGVRCLAKEETDDLVVDSMLEFDRLLLERKLRYDLREEEERTTTTTPGDGGDNVERRRRRRPPSSRSSRRRPPRRNVLRNVVSIADRLRGASSAGTVTTTATSPDRCGVPDLVGGGCCCYLNDPDVRMRFLRCESFDVPRAVNRFVDFLDFNSELFGDYVADRPIRISDFSTRKEEVALQNSRNQYLPFRDRSGRRVFVGVGGCDFEIDFDLRWKMMMYQHWIASGDVETQQKGVIIICWPVNEEASSESSGSGSGGGISWEDTIRPGLNQRVRYLQKRMEKSIPLRVVCNQVYFPDTPFFRALSTLYYIGMSSKDRAMYKAHFGETIELRYALLSYGIPEQLLPLSNTGTVKTANHSRWINALRAKADREERKRRRYGAAAMIAAAGGGGGGGHRRGNSSNFSSSDEGEPLGWEEEEIVVDCPGSNDVIFRKGPTYKNNPGNMYFRELIEQTHDRHMKASRKEKCLITWSVVQEIENRNGRFLDWSKTREMWIVARDREKIRIKVAACYKRFNKNAAEQRKLAARGATASTPLTLTSTSTFYPPLPLPSTSSSTTGGLAAAVADPPTGGARHQRDFAQMLIPAKRRKTFSLFCGTGYASSSEEEESCGFL